MQNRNSTLPPALTSLSARLLVLTVFFVMLAEFLIWTPSVSRFRKVYLEEQIFRAHLATLSLDSSGEEPIDRKMAKELLFHAGAYGIVLNSPERRILILSHDMPPEVDLVVDTAVHSFFGYIGDAFMTLARSENRVLRVIGKSPKDAKTSIEVLMDEAPMRAAMFDYSRRILNLSIVISLFTAGLVYLSLQWLMVRPMRRIISSISAFRSAPEDATREMLPSPRSDEIGIAQRELADMQGQVRQALHQQTRLATLGAAVAKINHDLRNSLATAVLAYDRLADVDDPEVKRTLPRMYNAIDRAVNLCSQTLDYASDETPALQLSRFALTDLIDEVGGSLWETNEDGLALEWRNAIDPDILLNADRDQLFRVFANLGRNAREAGATVVEINSRLEHQRILLEFTDNGPGIPAKAKENLFLPFAGSIKDGGSGLGLVIVRDILRAHGGDIELVESENSGATFRLQLAAARQESQPTGEAAE